MISFSILCSVVVGVWLRVRLHDEMGFRRLSWDMKCGEEMSRVDLV